MSSRALYMRVVSRALAFAVIVTGATLPHAARAQVVPAIRGGGSQINVYGLYALVKTDFNATYDYPPGGIPTPTSAAKGFNNGFSGGADFRLGRFVFGQPALGARFTYSTGSFGKQRTFVVGPELHYIYRKFRPYGDFLIGPGNLTYHGTGQTDNSIVYEFGGGLDYHKSRKLNFRLVDFQYQLWDLGAHFYPPGFVPGAPAVTIDTKLKPYTLSFGIVLRVK